jgi:hypothetical protein
MYSEKIKADTHGTRAVVNLLVAVTVVAKLI